MDGLFKDMVAIATAIVGLAILAVIVGQKSKTTDVIKSLTDGLSSLIKVAVSPVT